MAGTATVIGQEKCVLPHGSCCDDEGFMGMRSVIHFHYAPFRQINQPDLSTASLRTQRTAKRAVTATSFRFYL